MKKLVAPHGNRFSGLSTFRMILLTLFGVAIGTLATLSAGNMTRSAVQEHSLNAVIYKGYVVLIIDRTRNNWCDVQPTRVAFQKGTLNGEDLPVIIPMASTSLVWPFLGRQKFGLGVIRVKDLAPGPWNIMVTSKENCGWLGFMAAPHINETSVEIPAVKDEGQVQ